MEIKKPEYIVTIAEERSVTRAAARLYLTRPALSHYLLALESELGAPLFRRTRSGLEPTELGEAYIRGAQRVLDAVRQTQKELDDINGCVPGTLRIGIQHFPNVSRTLSWFRHPPARGQLPRAGAVAPARQHRLRRHGQGN